MDIVIKDVAPADIQRFLAMPDQLDRVLRHVRRVENAEEQEQIDLVALSRLVTDTQEVGKSTKLLVQRIATQLEGSTDPVTVKLAAKLKDSVDPLVASV